MITCRFCKHWDTSDQTTPTDYGKCLLTKDEKAEKIVESQIPINELPPDTPYVFMPIYFYFDSKHTCNKAKLRDTFTNTNLHRDSSGNYTVCLFDSRKINPLRVIEDHSLHVAISDFNKELQYGTYINIHNKEPVFIIGESDKIKIAYISHIIRDVELIAVLDDRSKYPIYLIFGKIEPTDTPYGKQLQSLIDINYPLKFSMRHLSTLTTVNDSIIHKCASIITFDYLYEE